jgi:calcium-translocating P-type ATPase
MSSHLAPASTATHHELPVHEVVLVLQSHLDVGLSEDEAADRLTRFGPNTLPPNRAHGPLVRFLLQFNNPLIYVLIVAAGVTLALGDLVESLVIAGVVLVNATVGFVQEQRASAALEALADFARTSAHVLRSGAVHRVDSATLVPGDIVQLNAGDKVPADLRLGSVVDLQVDESALTGESVPVTKAADPLPSVTVLADRLNMAYSGTLVTAGHGRGIVVATGAETELGRIHQLVGSSAGVVTPLTRRLARFSRWLTVIIMALAAVTFAIGIARGQGVAEMVTAAVALAVGAIPEGLPAAVTITLAIGVSRMARRHAIIRKLPAAETLGSTTVICTDKTGTLTQNRMTVRYVYTHGRVVDVGSGPDELVLPCLVAGVLCNDAHLREDPEEGTVATGDPTETALLMAASRHGISQTAQTAAWPRVDELPFCSERGLMATVHQPPGTNGRLVVVKGAAEYVLALCREPGWPSDDTVDWRQAAEDQAIDFGAHALRVLAFASHPVDEDWTLKSGLPTGMTFLGLQAMADPLREESVLAVAACQRAGISVKMITGDHPRTAAAIGREAGIGRRDEGPPTVTTGAQLAATPDEDLLQLVDDVDVFARVSADQKLRIVEALQAGDHIVAMTGDGINDAPALKQADIGIAMGYGGTEVAKEAAAMVLADDNFATIEAAVEEGRSIYDNLVKFITWTLPTNIGEGAVILAAIAVGTTLPITPVQILWINMTTAVALGLMLAFEPSEPGIMTRPPRPPTRPLLTRALVWRITFVGALMLIGAFGLFELAVGAGYSTEQARTLAVNAFVAMEIGYLFNCRSLEHSVLSVGLFTNRLLLLGVAVMISLQLVLTYVPLFQAAFSTASLPAQAWLPVVGVGVGVFVLVGLEKAVTGRVRRVQVSSAGPRVTGDVGWPRASE